ncbi:glycosyltransferase family 4 protein [Massilia eburnea]|uniref:glycosyltransferase family 4 protein n=1 Tax=Massilia eburnea TaxID=1776165 RepID=UPI003D6C347D
MTTSKQNEVCLVGHPYTPIGMGEHLRASFRSFRAAGEAPRLLDVYKLTQPSAADKAEFGPSMQDALAPINVFHINGDEIKQAWKHLGHPEQLPGYNVIYPLWELPRYPEEWASQLDRFDEIWAPSRFIMESLEKVCTKPIYHMPLSCQVSLSGFMGRRYFGIPEADYTFLFFYDLRSFSTRKNPAGVLRAFRSLLAKRPYSKAHLVIKVNGVDTNPAAFAELQQQVANLHNGVTLIQHVMTGDEVKNLVRCCDCFLSLHRSEGYGFGCAEAMALGRPVIATAYSGNMDFMVPEASRGVDYKLIPVLEGEYPHHENQVWADPDYDQAVGFMVEMLDAPAKGRALGAVARRHMQNRFAYRPTGLNYVNRLDAIRRNLGK